MVRAIKSIDEPSLPLRVYEPMRSTHRASQGMHITILDGRCPYFSDRLLFIRQVLHDFVMDRMVIRIPFQYIPAFIVFHCLFEMGMPGMLKIMVIPYCRAPLQWHRYYDTSFPSCHMQLSFSPSWSSSPLLRTALLLKKCLRIRSAYWASTISFTVKGNISSSLLGFANTWFILIVFVSSGSWVLLKHDQNFENIIHFWLLSTFVNITCVAWLYSLVVLSFRS